MSSSRFEEIGCLLFPCRCRGSAAFQLKLLCVLYSGVHLYRTRYKSLGAWIFQLPYITRTPHPRPISGPSNSARSSSPDLHQILNYITQAITAVFGMSKWKVSSIHLAVQSIPHHVNGDVDGSIMARNAVHRTSDPAQDNRMSWEHSISTSTAPAVPASHSYASPEGTTALG